MKANPNEAHSLFTDLQQQYLAQIEAKIRQIEAIWARWQDGPLQPDDLYELQRIAHNLAGSGATFGLAAVSDAARALDAALQPVIQRADANAAAASLASLVEHLLDVMRNRSTPAPQSLSRGQSAAAATLIYLAGRNQDETDELARQIAYFGYTTAQFLSSAELLAAVARQMPNVLILDLDLQEGEQSGIAAAALLYDRYGQALPMFFTASSSDFTLRLAAVRAGGRGYFTRPIDVGLLIDQIDQMTQRVIAEPYTVLIVDDSPLMAEVYALALRAAGMRVVTTTDPLEAPMLLAEQPPDLILLDVYMPGCNGQELAAVIRQQPENHSIPIVFLSGETDRSAQLAVLAQGGDDFLTKPINLEHLVAAISSRIQRARAMRSLMVRDSLTGLFNHSVTQDLLIREVARARRSNQPLSVVLIDIDHFKQVNDRYGHQSGDRVLKSLARLLRQRLRATDLIGRYGGEEFLIVMPETRAASAAMVIDSLRERFAHIEHQREGEPLRVTFSAGIAEWAQGIDASGLVEKADAALYQAKRHGRNQVLIADAQIGQPPQRRVLPLASNRLHNAPVVLVVDDDPDVGRLLQLWLADAGYRVELTHNGFEALQRIAQGGIDVALIDILMPEISGIDVLDNVRQMGPEPAVIMTTAFGSEQIAVNAIRHGADDYLRKPIDRQELLVVIERTLANLRLRRENAALQRRLDEKRRELEAEIKHAAQIQSEMLPQQMPRLPGYTIAARCIPAREVGGDFYDWHFPAPHLLNLTFGDVMGKGMSAALLMTTTRAVIRSVARDTSPEVNMRYAVNALHADLDRTNSFVTLCHLQLNLMTHTLAFVDAGHGLGFIRRHGGQCDRLEPRGAPLGIFSHEPYRQGEAVLNPGDALILFSDGLLDPWPALAREPLQINDLLADGMSATAIVDRLLALPALLGPLTDDLTVVVLVRDGLSEDAA
ncbi:diguanylate cyclase [Chloroflexus islandicus]|uniref:Diguanylate cyclase n=1 Tax=Chloroflexus islandicus TaxID=1707952 RepID=A0A178M0F1_9CHLR|nr:response regulator [Chloroflexus islandicus]OAN40832.1 diguanylate cyclase [Chloroflexus islandicus]